MSLVNNFSLSRLDGKESAKKLKSKLLLIFSFCIFFFLISLFRISYDVRGTDSNTSVNDTVISWYPVVFILGVLKYSFNLSYSFFPILLYKTMFKIGWLKKSLALMGEYNWYI